VATTGARIEGQEEGANVISTTLSVPEVARQTGFAPSTVSYNHNRVKDTGDCYTRRQGTGHKLEFTPKKQRKAAMEIHSARARDAEQVHQDTFPEFSGRTLHRHLANSGLPGRIRRRVPQQRPMHTAGGVSLLIKFLANLCRENDMSDEKMQALFHGQDTKFTARVCTKSDVRYTQT